MTTNQLLLLISSIFVLIGAALIWYGVRSMRLAKASKSWPKTPAKILRSEIRRYEGESANDRSYKVEVEYQFSVAGRELRGRRVQFGMLASFKSLAAAQKAIAPYPEGAAVDVYYDPAEPAQCTLDRTAAGSVVAILVIGVVFVVLPPAVCGLIFVLE